MIRALEQGDFDQWQELWSGYLHFYRADLPDDVTVSTFSRLVARTGGLAGLVAENEQGRLLGLAHLVLHPSTWSSAPYCYLEDLFVAPEARGTSTARDLIAAVYAEAERAGAARTYWHTQEFNGAARSLYDQVAHRTSFVVYEHG